MKEPEKPRPPNLRTKILARLMAAAVRLLCMTLRLYIDHEAETDALLQQGGMLVTWHGRTMIYIDRFRWRGYYTLVSLSRDGDLLSEYFKCRGFEVIRGSTGRRGVAATREVINALKDGGVLAFTPDGPRGPGGIAQPGVVYFAQRSGKPVITTGVGASSCWCLNTWDRFMIPAPFSRVVWIYGEPIYVSPDEDVEAARLRIEASIHALQAEAERRAKKP